MASSLPSCVSAWRPAIPGPTAPAAWASPPTGCCAAVCSSTSRPGRSARWRGELRANLLYRRFTRFDADRIPTYATFSRTFALLGPALTTQIQQRTVQQARQAGVAPGRTLRTDTTVVETKIHHPTDSSQLADGIRVLTRSMQRVGQGCDSNPLEVTSPA